MKSHILLIDDSEAVQTAISTVLMNSDYLLTTASTGAEGLSYAKRQQYHLILLDYSLPDTDGLSLLQAILKENPDIPIIMVTGSGSERIAVNALKSGASDYVIKSTDFVSKIPHIIRDNLEKYEMRRRNRELESQLRESYRELKRLNNELEEKVRSRTEELERAYQLSNELMAKAVDSNMQLAELYSEVDESRRKLNGKIRELSLLNEVGKILASTPDQDQLLKVTIDSIHQELGVEHCAILLLNEESKRLQIGVSRGTPDDLLLAAKSLDGEQILLDVLKKNTPLLIQDVELYEKFRALSHDYPGIECFMVVPLQVKNREIGVFSVYGYEDDDTFTQSDLEFISSLASQASIALANIALTNQRIQEEQIGIIGKITTSIMYDLKSSLQLIRGCTERIGKNETDPVQRKDCAQMILHELDRIKRMAQELREFSSGQKGRLNLQTVSVKDFVQDVLAIIERSFASQNISIHTELHYTGQFTIDVEKMKHVFINIADNARKSMSETGSLTITSRLTNEMIQFEFIDEGCGISPDLQPRLFEPVASDGASPGTGLGMTIVKKIIDEHHAQIDVQSVIAKGTTIRISLPCTQSFQGEEKHDVAEIVGN
jgi:signal transduction histidine kinase/DNA-binding response OmpR family regulator